MRYKRSMGLQEKHETTREASDTRDAQIQETLQMQEKQQMTRQATDDKTSNKKKTSNRRQDNQQMTRQATDAKTSNTCQNAHQQNVSDPARFAGWCFEAFVLPFWAIQVHNFMFSMRSSDLDRS